MGEKSFRLNDFRHTSKGFTVAISLNLKNYLEMVEQVPTSIQCLNGYTMKFYCFRRKSS